FVEISAIEQHDRIRGSLAGRLAGSDHEGAGAGVIVYPPFPSGEVGGIGVAGRRRFLLCHGGNGRQGHQGQACCQGAKSDGGYSHTWGTVPREALSDNGRMTADGPLFPPSFLLLQQILRASAE